MSSQHNFLLKTFTNLNEMEQSFDILKELYPTISFSNYVQTLKEIIPHNYKQIVIYDDETIVGLSGYWIAKKIWCGKYLEMDNVIVKESHRSKGIGKIMTDHLKKIAESEKCNMLALDVYTDNFKGIKFYMQEGYIPRGFHMIQPLVKDYSPH